MVQLHRDFNLFDMLTKSTLRQASFWRIGGHSTPTSHVYLSVNEDSKEDKNESSVCQCILSKYLYHFLNFFAPRGQLD